MPEVRWIEDQPFRDKRAVERGDVDHPSDVCMLFEDELRMLAAGDRADVRSTVAARRKHHQWLLTLEPPFILDGTPSPPPPSWTWGRP
jgi:hypothetical protein